MATENDKNINIIESVKEFYGDAAVTPSEGLCCPIGPDPEDTGHIPKEVLDISYGCGSPVGLAGLKAGQVMADLGSGGGIDCFIGAKKVGPTGKIFGIDMTDEMLGKANVAKETVSKTLGYANVEFKKGVMEDIPLEDNSVDVVTSNCVINLSPDKGKVLEEMYRIIKDGGKFCISDVVAEKEVPQKMQDDTTLWGECISGALKEDDFIELARKAGFYGLYITSRYLYREAEGHIFYSITLNGYKLPKGSECKFQGHFAIYNGPFNKISDDEDHEYPAGVPVEICTDTLKRLSQEPYAGQFSIIENTDKGVTVMDDSGCCEPSDTSKGGSCC